MSLFFKAFSNGPMGSLWNAGNISLRLLLDIMSMDFAYLKSHAPVVDEIMQILLAVGWALLIGNLVFRRSKYGGGAWL